MVALALVATLSFTLVILVSLGRTALFALDRAMQHLLDEDTDRASARVRLLRERPRSLMASLLIWHVLSAVIGLSTLTLLLALMPTVALTPSLLWLSVVGIALGYLLFFELLPRWLGTRHAYVLSRRLSSFLLLLHRVVRPASRHLARIMKAAQRSAEAAIPRRISHEDLKTLVEQREADGTIEVEEGVLINSLVEFGDTTVREIMTSRVDIVGIPLGATLYEAAQTIEESGHSRLPLYDEHLDNILGILYAKDLLPYLSPTPMSSPYIDWTTLLRKPMFVDLDMHLLDLLRTFKTQKMHIALVIDEYGGTAGLVTMEDLLEEIVGDILDEHDPHEERIQQVTDALYRVHARVNLDELCDVMDLDMDTEDFDFETIGGLIYHLKGSVPDPGDVVEYDGLRMRVDTVSNHRIERLTVRLPSVIPDNDVSPRV